MLGLGRVGWAGSLPPCLPGALVQGSACPAVGEGPEGERG